MGDWAAINSDTRSACRPIESVITARAVRPGSIHRSSTCRFLLLEERMRFSKLVLFVALLVLAMPVFYSSSVLAQEDPSIAQGINPTTVYHGSDIDSVAMSPCRLALHI